MLSELWNSSPENRFYMIVMLSYLPIMIFSIFVSYGVNSSFNKYSGVRLRCGLTADQIARQIMNSNGVYYPIVKIRGSLTDNFNPETETVSLSSTVYGSTSVAAAGVACHEIGHALQYATKYPLITFRSKLVPVVNFANKLLGPMIIIGCIFGLFTAYGAVGNIFVYAGLILFGLSMLFSLVTLPVELDASRRALKALSDGGYVEGDEKAMAKSVLRAAALTYLAGLLVSTWQFMRFLAIFLMRNRD
ncbi:MAG: zinc metallopeptidase [Clostridia bacterium]|nr:zinc metallopeptidase [Clostridia bacterium]